MQQQIATFDTKDFGLAAYLQAISYPLLEVRREGPRCVFRFKDGPGRLEATMQYFTGQGSIPPLSLVESIRTMKSLIHSTP